VHVVWVQLQVAGLSAEVWPASAARLQQALLGVARVESFVQKICVIRQSGVAKAIV